MKAKGAKAKRWTGTMWLVQYQPVPKDGYDPARLFPPTFDKKRVVEATAFNELEPEKATRVRVTITPLRAAKPKGRRK